MHKFFGVIILIAAAVFISCGTVLAAENADDPAVELLTLKNCLDLAYVNNQAVKLAAQNIAAAKAAVHEAEGTFWPLGTYELGYQNADRGEVISYCYDLGEIRTPAQGFGLKLKLTQPLYTGGKLTANLEIAKLKLAATLEDERKTKQELACRIKESFYGVWLAEQSVKVAQDSYANLDRHVQQVRTLRKVGTGSTFDVLQAEVQRDRIKPLMIKAANQLALAKLNLATLIGIAKDRRFNVDFAVEQLPIPEQNNLAIGAALEEACQNRPEIRQMAQLAQIKKALLKIAEAGYKPDIAVSVNYKHEGEDLFNADKSEKTWNLTFGLSGVFFDRFGTKARVDQAKIGMESVKTQEAGLRDLIRLEIEQSYQGVSESLETIRANRASIGLAKEALRMTQIRFEAGLATTMDVSDAQTAFDQALNGYYEGIYSYITATARFDLVTGQDHK
jgi:outer membrane protein TolC